MLFSQRKKKKRKDLFLQAPTASALSRWWLWLDSIAISVSPLASLFDQQALLSSSSIPHTLQPQPVSRASLLSSSWSSLSLQASPALVYLKDCPSLLPSLKRAFWQWRSAPQRFRCCFTQPRHQIVLEFIWLTGSPGRHLRRSRACSCLCLPLLVQTVHFFFFPLKSRF